MTYPLPEREGGRGRLKRCYSIGNGLGRDSGLMHLGELAKAVAGASVAPGGYPDADVVISGIAYDSRKVEPGFLFVAVPGERYDGHDFLPDAVEAGAAAVAVRADRADRWAGLPAPRLLLPDPRAALAPLACRFHGDPTHRLHLAGVTGTNGKTTTTRMIEAIAPRRHHGRDRTGRDDGRARGSRRRTTPEAWPPICSRFLLPDARERCHGGVHGGGVHALAQGRTDGAFDVGVFTNLHPGPPRLPRHDGAYRDAKAPFPGHADVAQAAGKEFVAVLNAVMRLGRLYAGSRARQGGAIQRGG